MHQESIHVATVNGYRIRAFATQYGVLYLIEGTSQWFLKLSHATEYLKKKMPKRKAIK